MPVNFVIGDACHMDFEDNTFDVVGIGNSLHHIPDLAALLAEMKRVVKPGGLIILSEMYNDGQPKASLTHWILHDIDCTMHTIDGIYHHPTYSKSEILWLARNAGLTVEKTLCDLIDDPKGRRQAARAHRRRAGKSQEVREQPGACLPRGRGRVAQRGI